jgi:hypothetical protein
MRTPMLDLVDLSHPSPVGSVALSKRDKNFASVITISMGGIDASLLPCAVLNKSGSALKRVLRTRARLQRGP